MKILVDAMGGDNAPLCVLQGAAQAKAEFGDGMELSFWATRLPWKAAPPKITSI